MQEITASFRQSKLICRDEAVYYVSSVLPFKDNR